MKKYATYPVMEVISSGKEENLLYEELENPFEIPGKDGYLYVRVRAIASKVNSNYDGFEREELRKAYKTFIGKPVFIEHQNNNPEYARGIVIDAAFHDDQPHAWIELLLEVDGEAYPLLAEGLRKGRINKVSMGTNVEYSVCSVCGNVARNEREYCHHIRNKGKIFKNANGEDVLAYEINRGLNFFEISFVVSPAEDWADVLAVYGEQDKNKLRKVASKIRRPKESVKCWNNRVAGLRKVAQIVKENDMEYKTDEVIPIRKKAQDKPDVIIAVSGGVAEVLEKKPGLTVEIRDYDVEGEDEEKLSVDENGDFYMRILAEQNSRKNMEKIATQGVFVNGARPSTKTQLRKALKDNPESVVLEATSAFGNEYYGPITEAPDGSYYIVGPHPYDRKWYAQIKKKGDMIRMSTTEKKAQKFDEEEISAPAKPNTIMSPEGEEIDRESLEPLEKKEDKTLDAFLDRLQSLIDEFKAKKEEEEPEEEIEEANEELEELPNEEPVEEKEAPEMGKGSSNEEIKKESDISYTQILLAKRLVQEMIKRGAISPEEEIDKEAEYSKCSAEELEEKIAFVSSLPVEAGKKVATKKPPLLKRSLAMDRQPLVPDTGEKINPSQMFI